MLSRTADSLSGSRAMSSAPRTSRASSLVGHRMASMARSLGSAGNEWLSTLIATGCEPGFFAKYSEATPATVIDYLVRDPDNPRASSPASRPRGATRARCAPRSPPTCGTRSTRPGSSARDSRRDLTRDSDVTDFLEWVRERSQLFNGAYASTMLRNDAYYFTRLGTFIERADNTARILDVKYYVLLPQDEGVGGALDYYQWQSILRSVSALRELSLGLSRAAAALADRRVADAAAGDAALADLAATTRSRAISISSPRPMAASAANATGSPARCMRGCATAGSRTSSSRACTNS